MRTPLPTAVVLLGLLATPALLPAQQAMPVIRETKPGLKARATLSADSAVAIALRAGPKGSMIKSGEIEEEKGLLIYSFDLTVPGKNGIQEIGIDAKTGKVVENGYESAADEAAEAKQDAKKTTPRR
jgi:hypothetical protein